VPDCLGDEEDVSIFNIAKKSQNGLQLKDFVIMPDPINLAE
jgi:hypothetical protein